MIPIIGFTQHLQELLSFFRKNKTVIFVWFIQTCVILQIEWPGLGLISHSPQCSFREIFSFGVKTLIFAMHHGTKRREAQRVLLSGKLFSVVKWKIMEKQIFCIKSNLNPFAQNGSVGNYTQLVKSDFISLRSYVFPANIANMHSLGISNHFNKRGHTATQQWCDMNYLGNSLMFPNCNSSQIQHIS